MKDVLSLIAKTGARLLRVDQGEKLGHAGRHVLTRQRAWQRQPICGDKETLNPRPASLAVIPRL